MLRHALAQIQNTVYRLLATVTAVATAGGIPIDVIISTIAGRCSSCQGVRLAAK